MKVQNQILANLEKSELDEATKWKHIAGPRYKHMDQKYESRITLKLFPMLKKYGINMLYKPIEDKLKQVGVKDARNIAKNFLFGQLYGIKGEENENTSRTI